MIVNNEKVLFDLEVNCEKPAERISIKLLKMDESNQYGQAMRKPFPYGYIKKQENIPSLLEFNKT